MKKKRNIIIFLTIGLIFAITSHSLAQGLTVGVNATFVINNATLTVPDNIIINGTPSIRRRNN